MTRIQLHIFGAYLSSVTFGGLCAARTDTTGVYMRTSELRIRLKDEQELVRKSLAEFVLRGKIDDAKKLRAIKLYYKVNELLKK